jgi:hypothetical protein
MPNDEEKLVMLLEEVRKYKKTKGIFGCSPEQASEIALGVFQDVEPKQ